MEYSINKLRATRLKRRISQTEFAETLGVSRVYLNSLEFGKKKPSFKLLNKWAKELGLVIKLQESIDKT